MKAKIPNFYKVTFNYTERTLNQRFVEWINKIIDEENLNLGAALQETALYDRRYPDIIITSSPGSKKVSCLIELKTPYFDVLNGSELVEPASEKAYKIGSPYFATSNINQLVLFSTEKSRQLLPLTEQIIDRYTLTNISDLNLVEQPSTRLAIQKNLKTFLKELVKIAKGKLSKPKRSIDDLLIYRLRSAIETLQIHYKESIKQKMLEDASFNKNLAKWFVEQNWNYLQQEEDFEKVSRQAAYLLVNKILFYTALQEKLKLSPLLIPDDLTDSKILKGVIQTYFNRVLEIDYQTIFTTDFIDELAFPENFEVVFTITGLIRDVNKFKMSELGYDVIGRIFEQLIPAGERHKLGQYFTRSDIVDFILRFCLKDEKDLVFDPSCGTGTFLVRAYQHKKLANPRLTHEEILQTLWGGDIAKFPAHLATINLAVNDLSSDKNFPGIFQKDFFELHPDLTEFTQPRRVITRGLETLIEMALPRNFDCLVGNPPYTRQEEMEDIVGLEGYKEKIIETVTHYKNGKVGRLGRRAGIYVHFFMHGWKFLKEGGRFGFIVSNSWLDVDYGKYLQEFFLNHYKIIAIIESKVERWFEEADINTCIVILEKCGQTKEREKNLVRFVQLKKPLSSFIPPSENNWEKEIKRLEEVDKLRKLILGHSDYYENEEIRIFPKKQNQLWEEGFDKESRKYEGSKWGKYIRAPQIFFKILERAKDKLVPLKEIADVRFGIKTGANEFFYLTEKEIKRWGIEKEFWMHKEKGKWVPNYVIKSPRECRSIIIDPKDLKYRVLMIHKDRKHLKGTNVLAYIKEGERKGFHERPTCASRKKWWDLEQIKGNLLCMMSVNDRFIFWKNKNAYIDARLYSIIPKRGKISSVNNLASVLNSTLTFLFNELWGRVNLGEGVLDVKVYEYQQMPIINPSLVKNLQFKVKQIGTIFEEIGSNKPEDVKLNKIKLDRRKLDKIIMGEILGLTEEEQLEVYKAVVDLVSSRLQKAKSVKNNNKTKNGVNIKGYVKTIMKAVGKQTLGEFYKEKITKQKIQKIEIPDFKTTPEIRKNLLEEWELYTGKKKIIVDSEDKARYLKVFAQTGLNSVAIPTNEKYLSKIVPKLEKRMKKIKKIADEYLSSIVDKKLRQKISGRIWNKICEGIGE